MRREVIFRVIANYDGTASLGNHCNNCKSMY